MNNRMINDENCRPNVIQNNKITNKINKNVKSVLKSNSNLNCYQTNEINSTSNSTLINKSNKRPADSINLDLPNAKIICKSSDDIVLDQLKGINWNEDIDIDNPNLDESTNNDSAIELFHNNKDISHDFLDDIFDEEFNIEELNKLSQAIKNFQNNSIDNETNNFYGLPNTVAELLESERGITKLYDWQDNLMHKLMSHNRNLVYCVPTSGGKTLVAELMILRELLISKKNAIFIFPYVSIVQEKIRTLLPFSLELDFIIEEYANDKGSFPVKKRLKSNCLYIATIEKAHLLITCLLEEKRLDEIGLIVFDELHFIGDGTQRGCTFESLLLLCMLAKRENYFNARLIAMSATLNNFEQISQFLDAVIEENNFRPVELVEYVKQKSAIYRYVGRHEPEFLKLERNLVLPKKLEISDPDNLTGLVQEKMPQYPILIFCPTKLNCENVAKLLSKNLPEDLKNYKSEERKLLLNDLQETASVPVCPTLKMCIPFGIAYHHSALTTDEREIIENGFLQGVLCVIVCTSTLAAGINLPAQRVIIRAPYICNDFITSSQYKQMIGRAGRAGLCEENGESILLINEKDRGRISQLFVDAQNQCISSIRKNFEVGVSRILLSLFHLNLVKNLDQIRDVFLNNTLFGIQFGNEEPDIFIELLNQQMDKFFDLNLILRPDNDQVEVKLTKLGKGAIKGLIDVNKCNRLYNDLAKLSSYMSCNSVFHLFYICTYVFDYEELPPRPNDNYIAEIYRNFDKSEKHSASLMGIDNAAIVDYCAFPQQSNQVIQEKFRRFFLTVIIYESYKGNSSLGHLSNKCGIAKGTLQQTFNRFASNAMSVLRFIEELDDLWGIRLLLTKICSELSLCANPEIIPLLQLPHVKIGRAKQLFNNNFKTIEDVAQAKPYDLFKCFDKISFKACTEMIKFAKQTFVDRADVLKAETEYCIKIGQA